ncbi:putative ABC transporter permease [Clostridium kluyveri]|uniref:Uncharacterized protein n=2 Tax=Clostridium kluyveri TaxID=1534 RepID=A5F9K5_CLOK5|nr:hypothetical protein [Clostridium kluyveri]ABQ23651.1 conserved hypothetical protein [Clostridium kluyveri DSM 555]BAH08525.1 hypothetical protein CKR_P06 [Clostridium kluyveri NBRC 12016]
MGYSYSNLKKNLILIFIMGSIYMVLEGLWRGWTHISMLVVGGIAAFFIGKLNEQPTFYNRKMWQQCIIGTLIILILEFVSGAILNIWLQIEIWDYSNIWGNILGQICIPYAVIWFLLVPFNIYIDDYLRYKFFGEKEPEGLLKNYKDLILGK